MKSWAVVALIAVTVTACSSSSKAKTTASTSPTTTAVSTDEQLAKQIVLQKSDVPADWSSTPSGNNSSSDTTDSRLTECLGLPPGPLIENATRADSDSFTSSTQQQASASVRVAKSKADVTSGMKKLSGPKVAGCVSQLLTQVLNSSSQASGQSLGTARVVKLPFDTIGDRTVAYRVSLPVSSAGKSLTVNIDFVVAQVGRVGLFFDGTSIGAPFPTGMSASLLQKMADRAKATE